MPELQPKLGYAAIISLAIGSIVGTGIFFGTAIGTAYALLFSHL